MQSSRDATPVLCIETVTSRPPLLLEFNLHIQILMHTLLSTDCMVAVSRVTVRMRQCNIFATELFDKLVCI